MKAVALESTDTDGYITEDSGTIRREEGLTPNGNQFAGRWVYRDAAGVYIDHDQYRHDLFERHSLLLV